MKSSGIGLACVFMMCWLGVRAERHYEFRAKLETVHEKGTRDASVPAAADDLVFCDGMKIVVPTDADPVLVNAAKDFCDYLFTSMDVSARLQKKTNGRAEKICRGDVDVTFERDLLPRQYRVNVSTDCVCIAAADGRTAAQALFHLEDLMNLRRAPYLKVGEEVRRMRFKTRMVHSGWGMDLAPEKYIMRMAHYGYDSLLIYIQGVGRTRSSAQYEDVNAVCRFAAAHGVDVWLYTMVTAGVHPDAPGAQKVFDDSYGAIAQAYPTAKGLVLVGESCRFPSKDERACSDPFEVKQARGDRRPDPGWFPCRDYPDWLSRVKKAISRHAPDMKVVFWTYNWSKDWTPETPGARLELIDNLPRANTILLSTFELPERVAFPNGHAVSASDYTIACPGPGLVFESEARRARQNGLELFTMCNTGGHTWDFGTSPFLPFPHQWNRRWTALVKAHEEWGLSGLMESHHYGWYPNFVSELAKEAYTDGGISFEEHVRKIAARDFGEVNAGWVVETWKDWSEKSALHPPTLGNQYGPFRIGPAYPFNFGGKRIENNEFPSVSHAAFGIRIFGEELWGERMWYAGQAEKEVVLLQSYAKSLIDGAARFAKLSNSDDKHVAKNAREMSVLAEYLGRTVSTAINTIRGALAWESKDMAELREIAAEEYANAMAALPLVDSDSQLGYECSMEYVGGREQIEWKLKRMEELFGLQAQKARGDRPQILKR